MRNHVVVFCVVLVGLSVDSHVNAGVTTEVVEQAGKAVVRAVSGEALEAGAKSAAKATLKKALQESEEAVAKRAAKSSVSGLDDLFKAGGTADTVADFAWRNKGTLVGGATLTTLATNPTATLAAGASMYNTTVETATEHVVRPAITFAVVLLCFLAMTLAVLGACFIFMKKQRGGLGRFLRIGHIVFKLMTFGQSAKRP